MVLGCFRLNSRWARDSSIVEPRLEDSEEEMNCD